LTETDGLTDLRRDILGAVREFVDAEIIPVAGDLDRTDTYPDQIVAGLRELGVFGLTIDPEYGGLGESLLTYALVAEEIARGSARRKDEGGQSDLEAGMAKYLASEYGKEVVEDALRIHGGYGYSQEYEIERLYRDVPMLLIGEGTAEIQKMIIGRRLLERFAVASG
jgi:alkylation response protein AidB-like acyl-CoA dehydrogenase